LLAALLETRRFVFSLAVAAGSRQHSFDAGLVHCLHLAGDRMQNFSLSADMAAI